MSNTSAEAWDLPFLDGEGRIALADFSGKPTVATFFANWCLVCEQEIPEFLALSENLGDRVNFVGINTQGNARGLGDAQKWGIDQAWPLARDVGNGNNSALSVSTFGAPGMPMTVVYDANGGRGTRATWLFRQRRSRRPAQEPGRLSVFTPRRRSW